MNDKKREHPYEYPNSYMQFLVSIRYDVISTTDLEGSLQKSIKILDIPTLDKR